MAGAFPFVFLKENEVYYVSDVPDNHHMSNFSFIHYSLMQNLKKESEMRAAYTLKKGEIDNTNINANIYKGLMGDTTGEKYG